MKIRYILIILVLACSGLKAQNLVQNPDFENQLNSWTKTTGLSEAISDSTNMINGTNILKLGIDAWSTVYQVPPLDSGKTYVLKATGLVSTAGKIARAQMKDYGTNANLPNGRLEFNSITTTTKWTKFTVGAKYVDARLELYTRDGGNYYAYFDDLSIMEYTAPVCAMAISGNDTLVNLPGPFSLKALASSMIDIQKVELYVDTVLISTATTAPYTFDVQDLTVGSHAVYAVAYDVSGGFANSDTITLNVNPPIDATGNMVINPQFDYGLFGWTKTTGLSEVIADTTKMINGTNILKLGIDAWSTVYQVPPLDSGKTYILKATGLVTSKGKIARAQMKDYVTNANLPNGRLEFNSMTAATKWTKFTVGAKYVDARLELYTRDGGNYYAYFDDLSILEYTAPVCAMAISGNDTLVNLPGPFSLKALASGVVDIQKVELYVDTVLISTATTAPYTFDVQDLAVGSHAVHAVAYDVSGVSANSDTITLNVNPPIDATGNMVINPQFDYGLFGWTKTTGLSEVIADTTKMINGTNILKLGIDAWSTVYQTPPLDSGKTYVLKATGLVTSKGKIARAQMKDYGTNANLPNGRLEFNSITATTKWTKFTVGAKYADARLEVYTRDGGNYYAYFDDFSLNLYKPPVSKIITKDSLTITDADSLTLETESSDCSKVSFFANNTFIGESTQSTFSFKAFFGVIDTFQINAIGYNEFGDSIATDTITLFVRTSNMIANPGFETGDKTGWTGWGTQKIITTGHFDGTTGIEVPKCGAIEQDINGLRADTWYILSANFKSANTKTAAQLGVKDYGWGTSVESSIIAKNTEYTYNAVQFKTDSTSTHAYIYLYNSCSNSGSIFGDNFKLYAGQDTEAPGAPANLNAALSDSSAIITWTASIDAFGIKNYKIYLNDSIVAMPTAISFKIDTLRSNTGYTFKIVAVDNNSNESVPAEINIKTYITEIQPSNLTSIHLKCYPNPVSNFVTIECGVNLVDVSLIGITGQMIGKYSLSSTQYQIDMSDLPEGIYNAKVTTENGQIYILKIVR